MSSRATRATIPPPAGGAAHPDNQVRSEDGTVIAFSRSGDGRPLILVDGAMCSRAFGPMPQLARLLAQRFTVVTYDRRGRGDSGDTAPWAAGREVDDIAALIDAAGGSAFVFGISSGAALALEAAKRIPAIAKLALYEAPFIVDDTHPPLPADFGSRLDAAIAAHRPGDAVKQFMRWVGTPSIFVAVLPFTPIWPKLKAVAHTLPYDIALIAGHHRGTPLASEEWAPIQIPALVGVGGKSPAWMRHAMRALADALPDARHHTLEGQTHMVKPKELAPVLAEFFTN